MTGIRSAVAILAIVALAGCAQTGAPGRMGGGQTTGTVAGALIGGAAGSQFGKGRGQIGAALLGAGLGAILGSSIGAQMDEKAKTGIIRAERRARRRALRRGREVQWSRAGARGLVQPLKRWREGRRECREYLTSVNIGGEMQHAYGVACRRPDGRWRIRS